MLTKDGSVTILHGKLQVLAVEMFKVIKGIAPTLMNEIFSRNENAFADNVSSNTRSKSIFYNPSNPKTVYHGLETLRCLGPKIWDIVPIHIKNSISLSAFKAKIKKWTPPPPHGCPCRLCKLYVPKIGFLWFPIVYYYITSFVCVYILTSYLNIIYIIY